MLYSFILALKRTLRSIYVPVMLLVMAVAIFFAPLLGHEEELPPAGICDLDNSEYSRLVCDYLLQNRFEMCSDEETLRTKVSKSEYDCGIIIPEGFEENLLRADLGEAIVFLDSPLSYQPELYRNHVGAAVFGEVAPYISVKHLTDTDIAPESVIAKYREMTAGGADFSFVLETTEAVEITENGHARTYVFGAAAILIFAFMMYAVCDVLSGDIAAISHRIGMKNTIVYTVIPDMCVRILGVITAVFLAAFASRLILGDSTLLSLIGPLVLYTVLAASFGIMLAALLANTGRIQIYTFFMLIMALVLCPIYIDLSLFADWLNIFRCIIPPYWLWLSESSGVIMLLITVVSVPLSLGAMYLRFARKPNK